MHKTLFLICLCSTILHGQNSLSNVGGRSWGMGHAMVAIAHGQTFFYNPAGLGFVENSYASSSFDSRFDISGLSTVSLSGVLAKPWATIGFGAERFGDQLYNENRAGIAIAKNTGRVSLGLKASYMSVTAAEISSQNALLTEFGVMAKLSSSVNIGFHAHNITGASLFPTDRIPTILRLGGAYHPLNKITVSAETEYIPGQNAYVKAGVEYMLFENFFMRTGINTGIRTNHFGMGYGNKKWVFDYAVNTHPTLGLSHHFSLQMNLPKLSK